MKSSYDALEYYLNNDEAIILYTLDYPSLRKIGFSIKNERFNYTHQQKKDLFVSAVDNEVSKLLKQPFEWLISFFDDRCNKIKIEKDTKRICWNISMYLYPYRGRANKDWWEKYKKDFKVGLDIAWSSNSEKIKPVIVFWIWHNNFDSIDRKLIDKLNEKRQEISSIDGFEAYRIIFGEDNLKRQGFVIGEADIAIFRKGDYKILSEEEITQNLVNIMSHYHKYKNDIIFNIAETVERKK